MAKRPAQGRNQYRRITRSAAGGDNVRTSGKVPRVNNSRARRLGNSLSK